MSSNLAAIAARLTTEEVAAGVGWYPLARRHAQRMAREHGTTVHRAAGVIAALSPRCRWAENLRRADKALASGTARGLFADKANRIIAGDAPLAVLSGQKVTRFYRNICGNLEPVTLDIWAIAAYLGYKPDEAELKRLIERKGGYERVEGEYQDTADTLGLRPAEFQASAWVHVRGHAA